MSFNYIDERSANGRLIDSSAGILQFFVNPDHQKRGYGSKLLDYICTQMDSYTLVGYAEVPSAAVSLFRRFGFKVTGRIESRYDIICSMLRIPALREPDEHGELHFPASELLDPRISLPWFSDMSEDEEEDTGEDEADEAGAESSSDRVDRPSVPEVAKLETEKAKEAVRRDGREAVELWKELENLRIARSESDAEGSSRNVSAKQDKRVSEVGEQASNLSGKGGDDDGLTQSQQATSGRDQAKPRNVETRQRTSRFREE